jgi:hypothetical protein
MNGNGESAVLGPGPLTPAERIAATLKGQLLSVIPADSTILLAVNVPVDVDAQGNATYRLSEMKVGAPNGLPKSLISSLEAAVERWAESERKRATAGQIIVPDKRLRI